MSSNSNARRANSSRRNKVVQWLRQQARPCWVCGLPIDYTLPACHALSFECDELVPVSKGGSPYDRNNIDATHRCCNNWRKNRSVDRVRAIQLQVASIFRSWSSPIDFVNKAKVIEKNKKMIIHSKSYTHSTQW